MGPVTVVYVAEGGDYRSWRCGVLPPNALCLAPVVWREKYGLTEMDLL